MFELIYSFVKSQVSSSGLQSLIMCIKQRKKAKLISRIDILSFSLVGS